MDKEKIREIVYILIAVIVSIIAVNIFIWLLPVILIVLVALFIYGSMKRSKNVGMNKQTTNNKDKIKNKSITIVDEEK